jgi:hypothetical protein
VALYPEISHPKNLIKLSESRIFMVLSPSLVLVGHPNNERAFNILKTGRVSDAQVKALYAIMYKNTRDILVTRDTESFSYFLQFLGKTFISSQK